MIDIVTKVDNARYSYLLENLLNKLNATKILRLEYESDWQGFVDIDVLIEDGRVFSYNYGYGSCPGCDHWDAENFTDNEIIKDMERGATFFDNINEYNKWRESISKKEDI